jgi:protein disulfide-isomerase
MEDDPKRPLKILVFIALVVVGFVYGRKWVTPGEAVPWRNDLATARTEANQAGKPVLLYFTADWCGPCQMMKEKTWSDPKVVEAMKGYVPVKIDIDAKADLARRYGVRSIPRVQLLTRDGQPGASMSGFVTSAEMADWLR